MTHTDSIIRIRKSLLVYGEKHGVTAACQAFSVSRTTYYKFKERFLMSGTVAPLMRRSPRMPNEIVRNKRELLLKYIQQFPMRGPRYYAILFRKEGISVSHVAVWRYLQRAGMGTRFKRLIYLETTSKEHQPVTERSLKRFKTHAAKVPHGLWPGHRVALDTFHVGTLKGVGRIYQITGIDLCSRFAWAKLYTHCDHSVTTDFVERTLVPIFFKNRVPIEAMVTDNGTEYVNKPFTRLLQDYDIRHRRIPPGKPVFNTFCERVQRTINEEFYQRILRIKFFTSLDQLQNDLNEYLAFYNFERFHFGLSPKGAIPADVFTAKRSFLRLRFKDLSA
jgi:transposase InsO family protein